VTGKTQVGANHFRWLTYFSYETGRPEVKVVPFPGEGSKSQVSTTGGWLARFSRNELFYVTMGNRLIVAPAFGVLQEFHLPRVLDPRLLISHAPGLYREPIDSAAHEMSLPSDIDTPQHFGSAFVE
jgi:hypothetical protein